MPKNVKLVFYSGGQTTLNHKLHGALSDLVGQKKRKKLTYIPYHHEYASWYFSRAVQRYKKFGFTDFECLTIDGSEKPKNLKKAFQTDAIYLAGGNTFYYLYHLKKSGLFPLLRKFAFSGGVIAGLSAGGVILTPNIKLAAYPKYTADKKEVPLRNLISLNLVPFHFYPHYFESRKLNKDLLSFSKKQKAPILAVSDGSGLVVEPSGSIQAIGKTKIIY